MEAQQLVDNRINLPLSLSSKAPIPEWTLDSRVRYFNRGESVQNFGDYLPEIIHKELLLHPRVEADIYRLVGSVIDAKWISRDLRHTIGIKDGTIAFWGCGARTELSAQGLPPGRCHFFGVRGPLTRDALGLPIDTVLGDPGLLAPLFHPPRTSANTAGKRICIPHVHDKKTPEELLRISGADVLISPVVKSNEAALRDILDQIAHADFVLTASLHGAIIAAAYGRPFAYWDNGHVDIEFKWRDFAASAKFEPRFVRNVDEGIEVYGRHIKPRIALPPMAKILDVCPFYARPSAILRALILDGRLNAGEIEAAARELDRLNAYSPRELARVQSLSDRHRRQRNRLSNHLARGIGSGVEATKKVIREVLGIR